MSKFWIVFKYELKTQLKKKSFQFTTIFLALAVVAAIVIGGFLLKNNDGGESVIKASDIIVYAVNDDLKEYATKLEDTKMYAITFVDNEAELNEQVIASKKTGVIVKDYDDVEILTSRSSIYSSDNNIGSVLTAIYRNELLLQKGLSSEDLLKVNSAVVKVETVNLGADGIVGYMHAYLFVMVIYMFTMLYGQQIVANVVAEKSSKSMEILVTSVKTTYLVFGKVLAVVAACLAQVLVVIVAGTIAMQVAAPELLSNPMIGSVLAMSPEKILFMIFLFFTGFISISFLFAGIGSFASNPSDANSVSSPVTMFVLVAFFIAIMGMSADILNQGWAQVLSFVPIFSPFILFSRYCLYGLSNFEMILGIITNLVGLVALVWFAAAIYRSGTLFYGNKPSIKNIIKSLKQD